MQDEPLLTITRVLDNEIDPEAVGTLDYRVHCQALEKWLAAGRDRETPQERQAAFAKELRQLADAIERGENPFTVTCEYAERRWAEHCHAWAERRRAEFKSV